MADIRLIGEKESLVDGKQKINDSLTALNNEVSGGATGLQERVTTLEDQEKDHETRLVSAEEALVDHENRLDNLVASAGDGNAEIVDARYDETDNVTYPTLGDRLNAKSEQIGNLSNKLDTVQINLEYPPVPMVGCKFDGTDDSTALQNIINFVKNNFNGAKLIVPLKSSYLQSSVTIPSDAKNLFFEGSSYNGNTGSVFYSDQDIILFTVLGLNITFEKITFKNTHGTLVRGYDAWGTGIMIGDDTSANPDECVISECNFFNLTYGIRTKSQNTHIKFNLFAYIRTAGVYLEGRNPVTESDPNGFGLDYYNRNIDIVHNRFHGCNGDAILSLTNVHKELIISDNLMDDISRGIVCKAIRSKLDGNIIARVRSHGIYVDNTGFDESISVINNTIIGISHYLDGTATAPSTSAFNYESGDGIHITSKGAKINDNTIMHKVGNGIWIGSGSEESEVNDNTIINCDNYNTSSYDGIVNASNAVKFDGNIIKRTTASGKQRYALNNSGNGCYFGGGNNYGSSSGAKVFNDTSTSSTGYASNLAMYRKVLYGGAPSVTSNLQKGDRWINVLASVAGDVAEYQFDGTAWRAISTLT